MIFWFSPFFFSPPFTEVASRQVKCLLRSLLKYILALGDSFPDFPKNKEQKIFLTLERLMHMLPL